MCSKWMIPNRQNHIFQKKYSNAFNTQYEKNKFEIFLKKFQCLKKRYENPFNPLFFNRLMHNVPKWSDITSKILQQMNAPRFLKCT